MWNTFDETAVFEPGKPWLLRFFDQIRFFPVTSVELATFRDGFLHGKAAIKVEPTTFRIADYRQFLEQNADGIRAFKLRQQAAFEAERARWKDADRTGTADAIAEAETHDADALAPGQAAVPSPVPGAVWRIAVAEGARVNAGDTLVVVESMKMEMTVAAPAAGSVTEIRCTEGRQVALGQTLMIIALEETASP